MASAEHTVQSSELYVPHSIAGIAVFIPALVILVCMAAVQPTGFIGGGTDDWQYLQAARCAADAGFCEPRDHWWSRWPLVIPTGVSLAMFGESRETLWLVPFLYAVGVLLLFTHVLNRQFGQLTAVIGSIVLAATPNVGIALLRLNVDIVEVFFLLATCAFLQAYVLRKIDGKSIWLLLCAGMALGIAIVGRQSALAFAPVIACVLYFSTERFFRNSGILIAGMLVPVVMEASAYWFWFDNPLLNWRLALSHTTIASTELAAGVDLTQSPLFNPDFIDNWKPAAGIKVHWTLDPILNLLAHPHIALTLMPAMVLTLFAKIQKPECRKELLWCGALMLIGAYYFGALSYGLAIDPKPRMFYPLSALGAAVIGIAASTFFRDSPITKAITIAFMALIVFNGLQQVDRDSDTRAIEAAAPAWIAQAEVPLAIDETSARILELVPEATALQRYIDDSTDYVLVAAPDGCSESASRLSDGDWQLTRSEVFLPETSGVMGTLRRVGLFTMTDGNSALCIFSRS